MRIAFIVYNFPTITETFIVNQITSLVDKGHQVRIFALQEKKDITVHQILGEYDLLGKVKYHNSFYKKRFVAYFNFSKFLISKRNWIKYITSDVDWHFLKLLYKYFWILEEGSFDIIHAHYGPLGEYIAKMKREIPGKPELVVSFHGNDLHPAHLNTYSKKYKNLLALADLILLNSPYSLELFRKFAVSTRAEILPAGLRTKDFVPVDRNNGKRIKILFVGRLIPLKGPDQAIRIMSEILSRNYKLYELVIIGEGELFEECISLIENLRLKENVTLLGPLPQERVIEEMARADIFLHPGIYDVSGRAETQGLVIQEAQAMEIPVVVSDVGGIRYGIVNGETGFLVEEEDIIGFTEKILMLGEDSELRMKMGKRGREFVKTNFESRVLGNKLELAYFSLMNKVSTR